LSKKSDQILDLAKKVEIPHPLPEFEAEGTLLERGLYAVLLRELSASRSKATVAALRKGFEDYNEARVSQAQELARSVAPKGTGPLQLAKYLGTARLIKEYLQVIFQETHGLDLEGLAEDPVGLGRQLSSIDLLGAEITSYLLFLAEKGELPVLSATVRVLDRQGSMARTSSVRKARELLEPLIPAGERLAVMYALGIVADRWCDSRKPLCWECPLLDDCRNGKKVFKEWKVQQERQAKQRAKDEARQAAQAKKDEARQKREAEREAKARAALEQKIVKAAERAERKKALEREAVAKKEAESKRREASKRAAAKQKSAAKKSSTTKKVSTRKKTASKSSGKKSSAKKSSSKKPSARQPSSKKPTGKKAVGSTQRSTAKKNTGAKKTAKRASTKVGSEGAAPKSKTPKSARKTTRKR
jgi:hypothetical protein